MHQVTPHPDQLLRAFGDRLNLILFATERCNFRCTYCYEDFAHGAMREDVCRGVCALISRRAPGLRALEISWFGGEPLLAMPVVRRVSNHVRGCGLGTGSTLANMTTNGYLLDAARLEELVGLGVSLFQVSLDGDGAQHDLSRRRADGRGTFRRIWSNLEAASRTRLDFRMVLRVHYSPATIGLLGPLVERVSEAFSSDGRFEVFFKAIERLGGAGDDRIRVYDHDAEVQAQRHLEAQLDPRVSRFRPDPPGHTTICYASEASSLAIRADGTVAKCTVALADDRNRIGVLRPDGRLEIDRDRLRPWLRGFETLDADDLACPLHAMREPGVALEAREAWTPLTVTSPAKSGR